jgi:uncharacterized protein YkwD
MKKVLILFLISSILLSCTPQEDTPIPQVYPYEHSVEEIDLVNKINHYRDSLGKGTVVIVEHVSYKCMEHNDYMILNGEMTHDYFYQRSENIKQVCDATRVGEILAYNFSTNTTVLSAWKGSSTHDTLIRSEYKRIGVSIRVNPINNRKFYTVIFID